MRSAALFIACLLLSLPLRAEEAGRGQRLYENHCGGCHYEKLHDRPRERSRVKSFTQLRIEVAQRAKAVKTRLRLEDLDDIAAYLNQTHYRFER